MWIDSLLRIFQGGASRLPKDGIDLYREIGTE